MLLFSLQELEGEIGLTDALFFSNLFFFLTDTHDFVSLPL